MPAPPLRSHGRDGARRQLADEHAGSHRERAPQGQQPIEGGHGAERTRRPTTTQGGVEPRVFQALKHLFDGPVEAADVKAPDLREALLTPQPPTAVAATDSWDPASSVLLLRGLDRLHQRISPARRRLREIGLAQPTPRLRLGRGRRCRGPRAAGGHR